jgi:hypothetical protein
MGFVTFTAKPQSSRLQLVALIKRTQIFPHRLGKFGKDLEGEGGRRRRRRMDERVVTGIVVEE